MHWQTEPRSDSRLKTAALVDVALRAPFDRPELVPWLGRSLISLDRKEAAEGLLTEAVARTPDDPVLRTLLARVGLASGDVDRAREQIDVALRLAPQDRDARTVQFKLLVRTEQWDAARGMTDVIATLPPFDYALCCLRLRDVEGCEALIAACDAELRNNPIHTNAIYFKAIALARLRRDQEARALIDLERSVDMGELPAPAGFADAVTFRDGLAAEIKANPTLTPDRNTTRGGLQTRKLAYPGANHIDALLGQIRRAVDRYAERLAGRADAFAAGRSQTVSLGAWAVIYGAQGRQMPHHHPRGWLSGVFYVTAPPPKNGVYPGSLVLGEVPERFGVTMPPWGTRAIAPVSGRLVLFPSYVPHATEETGITSDARISVAFDVVPVHTDG